MDQEKFAEEINIKLEFLWGEKSWYDINFK